LNKKVSIQDKEVDKMPIKLRKINEEDLEKIMNWRMLPDVTKYMYTDPDLTLADQLRWYKKAVDSSNEKYWIIQLEDGTDVGLLSLNHIDTKNSQCSWAYYIADSAARGKGLGRILECNIYDYVFDQLNLNKLWCEVFEFNENVIRIHEKFGSKIEGAFKDHICKNGHFYNVVRMAILNSEWIQIKTLHTYDVLEIEE
jgi:UDP-4-amino-4,6-dideoxy-N-acetyl-beta-L-altrosamine N-acetyltransferase